jgi:hypothetical protein
VRHIGGSSLDGQSFLWGGCTCQMSTHTLGKHPICHTSTLQHDGLGSHLNLNFIYAFKEKARTKQAKLAKSTIRFQHLP